MNEVNLTIQGKDVKLSLRKTDGNLVERVWTDKNNLLEIFFANLTILCMDAQVSKLEIGSYNINADYATGYTTQRIAATIIRALNYTIDKEGTTESGKVL